MLAVVLLILLCFGVGIYFMTRGLSGNSGTGTFAALVGQSCVSTECQSPLQCDQTTMTCVQPAPVDCIGGWSEWSACELIDSEIDSDDCATNGIQTKTYSITKNAEFGGKMCDKTHGQTLTKPCRARELHQLPRKCHPDAIYDCQGHYKDKDEHCRSLYEKYPDACGDGFMTQLPFIITKEEVSEVEKPDGKGFRTNVGQCPLRNTFIDTSCSGTAYC